MAFCICCLFTLKLVVEFNTPFPRIIFSKQNSVHDGYGFQPTCSCLWSVQFSSVAQSCLTLRPHESQASLSITNSRSSLRLTSIESVMPSSHLIFCRPLLLLPPTPPNIRVFSNESALHMRWPKYWSFSFSIIPSKEIPGLISFRMDCLDLLAVQGTLKSLVQLYAISVVFLECDF